jgi:hypothetical protein
MSIRYLALILLTFVALSGCAANQARMTSEPGTEQAGASAQIASRKVAFATIDIPEPDQQRTACQRMRPQISVIHRGGPCYRVMRIPVEMGHQAQFQEDEQSKYREFSLLQERQQMLENLAGR